MICFEHLQEKLATIYDNREANNIAQIIFVDAFGIKNPAASEQVLTPIQEVVYDKILMDLMNHRPWQYVLGYADFYGLKFHVKEAVLIPRPETEELVDCIIKEYKNKKPQILDIGTGSGCIAITLQKELPKAKVTAVDVSLEALKFAETNALLNDVNISLKPLDILNVEKCKKMPLYDIIVSNPPYIQESEKDLMPKQVLDFEPHLALFVSNGDPLQFYKAIADFALEHLLPEGKLYFEINEFFGKEVLQMLEDKGFKNPLLIQDMSRRDRIACCSIN